MRYYGKGYLKLKILRNINGIVDPTSVLCFEGKKANICTSLRRLALSSLALNSYKVEAPGSVLVLGE
jgi:hypothetical protein